MWGTWGLRCGRGFSPLLLLGPLWGRCGHGVMGSVSGRGLASSSPGPLQSPVCPGPCPKTGGLLYSTLSILGQAICSPAPQTCAGSSQWAKKRTGELSEPPWMGPRPRHLLQGALGLFSALKVASLCHQKLPREGEAPGGKGQGWWSFIFHLLCLHTTRIFPGFS